MEKILFICPSFFEYHRIIKKGLENKNYEVIYVDDRPSTSFITKCIIRVFPRLLKRKIKKYFQHSVIDVIKKEKIKNVFIVLGQSFTKDDLINLRKQCGDVQITLYLRDSIANFPKCEFLAQECNKVFSFDPVDCDKYGFEYLPLFYNNQFIDINKKHEKEYFASFIGTIKKGKYEPLVKIVKQVEEYAKINGKKCYIYLYIQSKLVYFYYKIFLNEFKNTKLKFFKFEKVSYKEALETIAKSEICIDVAMQKQNGLTMRTFETLALRTKLFTNNKNIKKEKFFDDTNIYVYENDKINFETKFFKDEFLSIDMSDYALDTWIDKVTLNFYE